MIKIAAFQADVTPPIGSPLCNGGVKPAKKIVAPLSARGIVMLGSEKPLVFCAVDWVGIGGAGHDFWRKVLAESSDTTVDRVTVHSLHPHDAPGHLFAGEKLAGMENIAALMEDTSFAESAARKTAAALSAALAGARPVTHYGYGKAKVSQVASNRRMLGPDGRVAHMRWSSCADKALRDLPEGLIDPWLQNLSFWDGEEPVVSITYYATHPQSFYKDGAVNPDFVGLARSIREATLPGVVHLHFNGCGGNIAAGKYNDHSPKNRLILAQRLLKGMESAWAKTKKYPIGDLVLQWRVKSVNLPMNESIRDKTEEELLKIINSNDEAGVKGADGKIINPKTAMRMLVYLRRRKEGRLFDIACLQLGKIRVMHLPGEMFVEYQLAAQKMRPRCHVLTAAYGNYECGYVGTKQAYAEGGYETADASRVAPESEGIILEAMRELLTD